MPMTKKTRDAILYVLIGLAVAGAGVAIGIYDSNHHLTANAQMLWTAAGVFTCFVFGFLIKANLRLFGSLRAWGVLFLLLLLHGTLVTWVVHGASTRGPTRVPLLLFAVVSVAEITGFGYIFEKLTSRNH
jgi:hypothetical protein